MTFCLTEKVYVSVNPSDDDKDDDDLPPEVEKKPQDVSKEDVPVAVSSEKEEDRHQCDYCPKSFLKYRFLRKHMKVKHPKKKKNKKKMPVKQKRNPRQFDQPLEITALKPGTKLIYMN